MIITNDDQLPRTVVVRRRGLLSYTDQQRYNAMLDFMVAPLAIGYCVNHHRYV